MSVFKRNSEAGKYKVSPTYKAVGDLPYTSAYKHHRKALWLAVERPCAQGGVKLLKVVLYISLDGLADDGFSLEANISRIAT